MARIDGAIGGREPAPVRHQTACEDVLFIAFTPGWRVVAGCWRTPESEPGATPFAKVHDFSDRGRGGAPLQQSGARTSALTFAQSFTYTSLPRVFMRPQKRNGCFRKILNQHRFHRFQAAAGALLQMTAFGARFADSRFRGSLQGDTKNGTCEFAQFPVEERENRGRRKISASSPSSPLQASTTKRAQHRWPLAGPASTFGKKRKKRPSPAAEGAAVSKLWRAAF